MKSRELEQLLLVAAHYLALVKRSARAEPSILKRTVDQGASSHVLGKLHRSELVLAHLASAAIRLATVCEKERAKFPPPYRIAFYKNGTRKGGLGQQDILQRITSRLDEHVHFLLRDAVAHEENVKSDMANDRAAVLKPLTVQQVLEALDSCAKTIRASV